MADLIVVLISGEVLTRNLVRSLGETNSHPWAFADWKRQMQALVRGTRIAFLDLVDGKGRQVSRFTSNSDSLMVRRIVLGTISRGIQQVRQPYFEGYPHEFWFDGVADDTLATPLDLDEAAAWFNARVTGLDLEPDQLVELIRHAKANKVGAFVDGAPRKADHFRSRGELGPPGATKVVTVRGADTAIDAPAPRSGLGAAVNAFADAVEVAGVVFGGINGLLPQAFLAALTAKRFAILSGLSGSGKTQLAKSLGQWLGVDEHGPRYLVVPVRPDWTSPEPLLGYEDALLAQVGTRRAWTVPATLEFMLRAVDDPTHIYLLVLDEMNLAHVERYFADVLSAIESGECVLPAVRREDDEYWRVPEGHKPLPVPSNLIIVGTVNVDETTYPFSPKVLDRAFTFDFRVATDELDHDRSRPRPVPAAANRDLAEVHRVLIDDRWHIDHPALRRVELVETLREFHRKLTTIGFEFGHRTFYEAMRFAATLGAAGIDDSDLVLDWILMTKLLPRLHGSRRQLEHFLDDLLADASGVDREKPLMPLTARKAGRMLELVRANQFVSFAE